MNSLFEDACPVKAESFISYVPYSGIVQIQDRSLNFSNISLWLQITQVWLDGPKPNWASIYRIGPLTAWTSHPIPGDFILQGRIDKMWNDFFTRG